MATMAFQGTSPASGGEIVAEPLADSFIHVINTYNGANIDEGNCDTTSTDGVMGLSTAQTVTGQKTFSAIRITNSLSGLQVRVWNDTGSALAAGEYLYVSAYNSTQSLYTVAKAQAKTSASLYATLVCDAAIANGAAGNAILQRLLTAQNTDGLTVGRPVWLSGTAGGWTGTVHTDGKGTQIVGMVIEAHATTGRILQFPGSILPWAYAGEI